jgi:hypothetical protein
MSLKKNTVLIYSLLLFLTSAVVVFLIFPKDKHFAYSFSVGSPWLYEDLVATSDFPVYKTDQEIKSEKDSIYKSFIPYYVNDSLVTVNFINSFNREMSIIENEKFGILTVTDETGIFELEKIKRKFNSFADSYTELVLSFYRKGVIGIPDTVENEKLFRFYLYGEGMSELSYGYEFLTMEWVNQEVEKLYDDSEIKSLDSLNDYSIKNLLIKNPVPSNIVFDDQVNSKILENKLNSISPVSGMVKSGEMIVRKGNIVGDYENRVLLSLRKHFESKNSGINNVSVSFGTALIFLSLFIVIFIYLMNFQTQILSNFKDISFLSLQILLLIFAVYFMFSNTDFSINIIPYALFPLLILTFFNFQISLIIYLTALFVAGFFAPNSFEFIFIQTLVGIIAMFSLKHKHKRRQVFVTMGVVFVSYLILATGFYLIKQGTINSDFMIEMYPYAISSFLLLLYLPFVFIFEKIFSYVSDFTLMELSDTNNPALRLLAEKSPGTFQHSVQVANLVESVVRELGGNYMLARTGALYHDIGKSKHPEYFIENQSGNNIHDKFDFEDSAQKIISHVKVGEELAKKYKLPAQVIDFITMHHGTSLTKYFYNSWINANPESLPVISNFKYPGPKPQSIETAVMMMADAIEAACRTLPEYSQDSIEKLVSRIIDAQLNDGQLVEVEITLKQLGIAKKVFAEKIKNIYHARVVYPEINNKY